MGKKRSTNRTDDNVPSDDRSGRKTAPVQIYKHVVKMIRTVTGHRGWDQAEWITPMIERAVVAEYKKLHAEMGIEIEELEKDL